MAKRDIDMINGSLYKSTVKFALPLIATGVLSQLFHNVDMIVVGQFCDKEAVAAVGATGSLVSLVVALFLGLATGVSIVVSQTRGGGDDGALRRAVHTAVLTAIISGIILTAVGVPLADKMLIAMNTPAGVIRESTLYLRIYFAGIILRMLYVFTSAVIRAMGDSRTPFIYLTVGGVLNVIFNIFFVVVCHMRVAGVALGTIASEGFSGIMCLIAVMRRKDAARFSFAGIKKYFDKNSMLRIIKIGVPAGIESSLFAITNTIVQRNVNSFGTDVVAGGAAASAIFNNCNIVVTSFSSTASVFMGQNLGAGRFDRIKKLPRALAFWDTVLLAGTGVLIYLFANPLISLFIKGGASAYAHEIGVNKLRILLYGFLLAGFRSMYSGLVRGMGKSFSAMIISLFTICGVRIAVVELGLRFVSNKPQTVFWAYPISFVAAFSAVICYYYIAVRREERKYAERQRIKKAKDV